MRREVDDQQPPAGRQQPADLANRPGRIVEEVQHLMDHDQVERVVGERRAVDVALAKVDAADLGTLEVGACNREHRVAAVEADGTRRRPWPSSCNMRPVPVPTSSTDVYAVRTDRLEDRLLDDCVRCVQRALLVPPRRDPGEVLLSGGGAATTNDRQPIEIGREHAVAGVGECEDIAGPVDRSGRW